MLIVLRRPCPHHHHHLETSVITLLPYSRLQMRPLLQPAFNSEILMQIGTVRIVQVTCLYSQCSKPNPNKKSGFPGYSYSDDLNGKLIWSPDPQSRPLRSVKSQKDGGCPAHHPRNLHNRRLFCNQDFQAIRIQEVSSNLMGDPH